MLSHAQIDYPEIADGIRPRHRFMSAYEQRMEPPDRQWQYLLFAAEPYETIAFKVEEEREVASFPGLLHLTLVKLLRRMTSGERLEAWLIAPCMHNTAVHQKCHAFRHPPDVILRRSFTSVRCRRPGNEATREERVSV